MKTHFLGKEFPPVFHFDAKDPVILTVAPGDIVVAETRFITDPSGRRFGPGTTLDEFLQVRWPGHALFGPLFVEGAEPGDMLEVRILEIEASPWALTFINTGMRKGTSFLPDEFKEVYLRHYDQIDLQRGLLRFSPGVEVPIGPHMGQMAVAPRPRRRERWAPANRAVTAGTWTGTSSGRGAPFTFRFSTEGPSSTWGTATSSRATERWPRARRKGPTRPRSSSS